MSPTESIDLLVADGIVDALIQRVKTGKEAEVFIVQKGENFFAAKVYKERTARTFKNNVAYKEGRVVKNTRDARAIAKGSKYGLSLAESDWRHMEHDALVTVLDAGVRVPKPELIYEGILVMELVLGNDGQPAPRIIDVPLSKEEALTYHREIVGFIVGMLTCDLIHGDLSPYNILMAWNGPTIIDLPQAIKAAHNNQAEQFLVRDVRNVTEHFARYAPELKNRVHDGYAIWKRYMKRDLERDYFPEEGEGQPPKEKKVHVPHHPAGPRREVVMPPRPAAPARPPPASPATAHPPANARPAQPPRGPQQHPGGARPQQHSPRPQQQGAPQHQGAPRPNGAHSNGAPRPPRPPQHAPAHQGGAPQNAAPAHQNGAPQQPRPERPPQQVRPEGQRPPHRNNNPRPNGPPQRRPDAPRRPTPSGPVIERVTRLTSPVAPTSGGPTTPENRPARFSHHHRNRPS